MITTANYMIKAVVNGENYVFQYEECGDAWEALELFWHEDFGETLARVPNNGVFPLDVIAMENGKTIRVYEFTFNMAAFDHYFDKGWSASSTEPGQRYTLEQFAKDIAREKEENEEGKMKAQDFNRLSIEANNGLFSATIKAMNEIQGDDSFANAVESELFCHLWPIQVLASGRMMKHERKKMKYEKAKRLIDLQKELYQRMRRVYNNGECGNRELTGIAWHMEKNGVFAIDLKDCAINLEHSIKNDDGEGTAITVWLNLPLLEKEDPDNDKSFLAGEYDEFVDFCCLMRDERGNNPEYRDACLDCHNWRHFDLIRDTLAGLDVIEDMMNKTSKSSEQPND